MGLRILGVKDNESVDYPLFLLRSTFFCRNGCNPTLKHIPDSVVFQTFSKSSNNILLKALLPLCDGRNNICIFCPHQSFDFTLDKLPMNESRPYVRPIYVTFNGHDGSFQAPSNVSSNPDSACRRLGLAVRILQSATAEIILAETGYRRSFACAGDFRTPSKIPPRVSASPVSAAVWCIQSKLSFEEAQRMSVISLWETLARELHNVFSEDRGQAKWLAVVSCTEFKALATTETTPLSHEAIISRTVAYCALGAGGLALFGSGNLYTWPESIVDLEIHLSDLRKVNRRQFLDDSAYRGTYWANYTTALGTMLHELGHCFDLDHSPEGIMRRGGDDLNLIISFPPPGVSSDFRKVNNLVGHYRSSSSRK
uniref:Zinc metalloproteinase YIL108W n=1 Tax=Mesocestoides corti TaxID=53468 RepID=A0A5K3EQP5_MESCO